MRLESLRYHAAKSRVTTLCGAPIKRENGHLPWDDPEDFVASKEELNKCRICIRLINDERIKQ